MEPEENAALTIISPQTSTPTPLEEFTLFPNLPTEIRLSIWHSALSQPQRVIFKIVQTPFSTNRAFMKRITRVNPLLHVSRESRAESLRAYKRSFSASGALGSDDIWDIWRYFRFGIDSCELRNESNTPWVLLVGALIGKERHGLERVIGGEEGQGDVNARE